MESDAHLRHHKWQMTTSFNWSPTPALEDSCSWTRHFCPQHLQWLFPLPEITHFYSPSIAHWHWCNHRFDTHRKTAATSTSTGFPQNHKLKEITVQSDVVPTEPPELLIISVESRLSQDSQDPDPTIMTKHDTQMFDLPSSLNSFADTAVQDT